MNNRDTNPSQGFKATDRQLGRDWETDESYWKENWQSRPYASADRRYDYYEPAYRYGYEAASGTRNREWSEAEGDLRSGWDRYDRRGQTTWESIKDAVRDAWHRATGRT